MIRVEEDRVFEVDVDVMEACIKLQRDKFLRQRASRRVAMKRLCKRDLVCVEGVLNGWVAVAFFLIFWLLRIQLKSTNSLEICSPSRSGEGGMAVPPSPQELDLETTLKSHDHLAAVSHQQLIMSGDVETNPGPLDEIEIILSTTDNTTFDEDDWNVVIMECSSLAAKWERLSSYLGLPISLIDSIKENFRGEVDGCWSESLKHWISQNYTTGNFGLPSWRSLLKAVARVDKRLFKKLADTHQVGECATSSGTNGQKESGAAGEEAAQVGESDTSVETKFSAVGEEAVITIHETCQTHDTCIQARPAGKKKSQGLESSPNGGSKPLLTFPCLDLSKMCKEEKQQLHQRLYAESVDMVNKFQDLFSATTQSLKVRKVSVKELLCHLVGFGPLPPVYEDLDLPAFRRHVPELTKSKKIEDAMLVIGNYCSFFNFCMIEHIINKLGTRQDVKNLTKYKEQFSIYATRLVFQCPSEVGTVSEGLANMFVTLDETFNSCTVTILGLFVENLRKILNIPPGAVFKLCRIAPGSLKLTIQLSDSVAEAIFPLSDEKKANLIALGVDSLTCGQFQFNRQNLATLSQKTAVGGGATPSVRSVDSGYSGGSTCGSTGDPASDFSRARPLRIKELCRASCRGDLDEVKRLIESEKLNPLQKDSTGCNALHHAATGGDVKVVRYLVNEMSKDTPLKDVVYDRIKDGSVPLHVAAFHGHLPVVKLFITAFNVDPNTPGFMGRPPLHAAAQEGHLDIVMYLVEELKCDPSYCSIGEDKVTPLHITSQNGHLDVVKYLTVDKHCNPLNRDSRGNTSLHLAIHNGHFKVVEFFISQLNCDPNTPGWEGRTPLHNAAQEGQLDIVKYLIEEKNCDPSCLDERKSTPLHVACLKGHLNIVKYLTKEQHCNPLCYDMDIGIPLHWAAHYGQLQVVKYFIEDLNCPQNIRGAWNNTPLQEACSQGRNNVVQYLMQYIYFS